MAASIKDIAKALNISVSTVSYALNGGPRPVRTELRDQILAVARDLDYRPNRMAQAMITGRSHTIGIVLPEILDDAFLSPYLHNALNGIANEAGHLHQDILVFTRYSDPEPSEMLANIMDGRADGVIFIAPNSTTVVEQAVKAKVPCVTVSSAAVSGVLSFSVDNSKGVDQIMQHLYDLGHRKIGHIAGRLDMQDALVRLAEYQRFLRKKRLMYRDEWVTKGQFLIEGGSSALRELVQLEDPPTAVFCANDEMAIGATLECHRLGIKVPQELSIVGFDCSPTSEHVFPPITTIRQPIGDLSAVAVRALIALVEGREPEFQTVFDTELVIRSSTTHPMEKH